MVGSNIEDCDLVQRAFPVSENYQSNLLQDVSRCAGITSPARLPPRNLFLRKLQHEMNYMRVLVRGGREAKFFEYFSHCDVLGQNVSR